MSLKATHTADGLVRIGGHRLTPSQAIDLQWQIGIAVRRAEVVAERCRREAEAAEKYAEVDALEASGWHVARDEHGAAAWHPVTGVSRLISWRGVEPRKIALGRAVPTRGDRGRVAHEIMTLGGWATCIHCGERIWPATLAESHTLRRCAAWQRAIAAARAVGEP